MFSSSHKVTTINMLFLWQLCRSPIGNTGGYHILVIALIVTIQSVVRGRATSARVLGGDLESRSHFWVINQNLEHGNHHSKRWGGCIGFRMKLGVFRLIKFPLTVLT